MTIYIFAVITLILSLLPFIPLVNKGYATRENMINYVFFGATGCLLLLLIGLFIVHLLYMLSVIDFATKVATINLENSVIAITSTLLGVVISIFIWLPLTKLKAGERVAIYDKEKENFSILFGDTLCVPSWLRSFITNKHVFFFSGTVGETSHSIRTEKTDEDGKVLLIYKDGYGGVHKARVESSFDDINLAFNTRYYWTDQTIIVDLHKLAASVDYGSLLEEALRQSVHDIFVFDSEGKRNPNDDTHNFLRYIELKAKDLIAEKNYNRKPTITILEA